MSGECDKCGEHGLDCMCNYRLCQVCEIVIYRRDGTCMNCLIKEARDFSESINKKIMNYGTPLPGDETILKEQLWMTKKNQSKITA